MAIPIFQIMVLKSRAVRKSWVDLLVGPGGVETVRGRVGRVNRFSNLAGRISSGQDYFEYHGSARHGSGRVKSFFNITGRVENVSNLTDQARSDQEAMNTHGSGRVSPREKRVVFCWQADRTRGSGPRIRPLKHITVGYNNKKKNVRVSTHLDEDISPLRSEDTWRASNQYKKLTFKKPLTSGVNGHSRARDPCIAAVGP